VTASGGGRAVADATDQGFGGMGELTQAVQTEKPAGTLYRVNQTKNAGDHRRVRRIALEQDKLRPDRLDLLGGFGQKSLSSSSMPTRTRKTHEERQDHAP